MPPCPGSRAGGIGISPRFLLSWLYGFKAGRRISALGAGTGQKTEKEGRYEYDPGGSRFRRKQA